MNEGTVYEVPLATWNLAALDALELLPRRDGKGYAAVFLSGGWRHTFLVVEDDARPEPEAPSAKPDRPGLAKARAR